MPFTRFAASNIDTPAVQQMLGKPIFEADAFFGPSEVPSSVVGQVAPVSPFYTSGLRDGEQGRPIYIASFVRDRAVTGVNEGSVFIALPDGADISGNDPGELLAWDFVNDHAGFLNGSGPLAIAQGLVLGRLAADPTTGGLITTTLFGTPIGVAVNLDPSFASATYATAVPTTASAPALGSVLTNSIAAAPSGTMSERRPLGVVAFRAGVFGGTNTFVGAINPGDRGFYKHAAIVAPGTVGYVAGVPTLIAPGFTTPVWQLGQANVQPGPGGGANTVIIWNPVFVTGQ